MDDPTTLLTLEGLEARLRASGVAGLDEALAAAARAEGPERRTFDVVRAALALDRAHVERHPEDLFACLWNRLRWYDAKDAAEHYEPAENAPWSRGDARLQRLAEEWRTRRAPRPWLAALRPLPGHPDAREKLLRGHEAQSLCAAFDATGKRLVTGSWDDGGNVRIWDVATATCELVLEGHDGEVLGVAWSHDGALVASGSRGHDARVWDARTGELVHDEGGQEGRVTCVGFAPDGRLAVGNLGWVARIHDAKTFEERRRLEGHEQSVLCLAWHPSGRFLATGSSDETVRLWDATSGRLLVTHEAGGIVHGVSFAPDGEVLAVAGASGLQLVETKGWTLARTLREDEPFDQVAWLPGGRVGAFGWNGVHVFDAASGALLRVRSEPRGHGERHVAFHPDGHTYAITGDDGTVRLHDVETAAPPELRRDANEVRTLEAWPEAGVAVVELGHQRVVVDATGRARPLATPRYPLHGASWAASADGRLLAQPFSDYLDEGSQTGVVIHDVETLAPRVELRAPVRTRADDRYVPSSCVVAFAPDGKRIAFATEDGVVRTFDVETGAPLRTIQGAHEGPIAWLAFALGGAWIASASFEDRRVRVHDVATGSSLLDERVGWVDAPAIAFAGPRVLVGRADGAVRLLHPISGDARLVATHDGGALGVFLSSDGRHGASSGRDGIVRVFEVETGRVLHELAHSPPVIASIVRDRVITLARDRHARFFDLATGELRHELAAVVDPREVASSELWTVLGDELAIMRGPDAEPVATFPDGMKEVFVLRGKVVVGRGQREKDALYVLELRE